MPVITATTILDLALVEPQNNPNDGRVIINDNFDKLKYAIYSLETVSSSGTTMITPGTNISTISTITSGVPNYTVSVVDNPVFTSVSSNTLSLSSTTVAPLNINVLSADPATLRNGDIWMTTSGSSVFLNVKYGGSVKTIELT